MKRKSVLFGVLVFLVIIFLCVPLQSSDVCNAPPPEGPPPDNADDNFSYNLQGVQTDANPYFFDPYPFVGILKNGNTIFMENLLTKIGRKCLYVDEDFNPQESLKKISLLIIPTGGLWGTSKSEYFKTLLENFLNGGGHILCFAQQDFSDFQALPLPSGESLHALETEQCISLPPAGEIEVPISFTLTDVQTEDLGIYGTYYQLFDAEENQVLNSVESDSGRFALYSTPAPYVPKEQCQYWLTVDNEEVHYDDPVSFVLHARNYTDTEKQVETEVPGKCRSCTTFFKMHNFSCTNFPQKNQPKNTTNDVLTDPSAYATLENRACVKNPG